MYVYLVRIQRTVPPKSSWSSVHSTEESALAEIALFARDTWAKVVGVNFAFEDYTEPKDAVRVFFTNAPYRETVLTKVLRGPEPDESVVELSHNEVKVTRQALYTANYNELSELTNIPRLDVMSLIGSAGDKLED